MKTLNEAAIQLRLHLDDAETQMDLVAVCDEIRSDAVIHNMLYDIFATQVVSSLVTSAGPVEGLIDMLRTACELGVLIERMRHRREMPSLGVSAMECAERRN